jgi:thioesterase domain-containing protein/acyl carrier protein
LIVPKKEAPVASRATQPYANNAEKVIAQIYKNILGVESVAAEDDFFELGGHSLLAVRLVSELERAFGRAVPLGDIFRTPTVAALASVLMNQEARVASSIVAIQSSGTLQPFFCVHSQTSNVLNFRALATLLGPDQPFYGLEPRGLDGKSEPYYRIEDMAAQYVDEIRRVQSEGPYHIGGVCLGGVVALEMAQQLHASGHEVALVALIDSHFPALPRHFQRIQKHSMFLWRVDRLIGELLARSPFEAIRHAPARIYEYMRRRNKTRGNSAALAKVISANIFAEYSYVPKPYPGSLVLFWCSGWAFRAYQDTRLAWSEVAEGGLEVHVVPGNHISMMEPPNVEIVASKLSKCLEKSRSSTSKLAATATRG